VIEGAENGTFSIFATGKKAFRQLFPDGQDIEFLDDLFARLGKKRAKRLLADLWEHPVEKSEIRGLHGTLFYQLDEKKQYYPTKREAEMQPFVPKRVYCLLWAWEKEPGDDGLYTMLGKWELPGALEAMRKHFSVPDDEPMSEPVGPEDIEAIKEYLAGHTIDLERWHYAVEEVGDYPGQDPWWTMG